MNETGSSVDQSVVERVRQAIASHGLDWDPATILDLWREVFLASPINVRAALLRYQTDGQLGLVDMTPDNLVSRQMARSMAATERVWGLLEGEFGLFTAEEAAKRFGPSAECLNQTTVDQGMVIGVVRRGELRFPGFQVDPVTHEVRPVIRELITIAGECRCDMEDLTLLMVNASTYFEGATRPVDHLEDPTLPDTVRQMLSVEW